MNIQDLGSLGEFIGAVAVVVLGVLLAWSPVIADNERDRTVATDAQDAPRDVLATLEGRWEGEGVLLERQATFAMTWEKALNGRFLRLEFSNSFADVDPPQPVLESQAYYLLGGSTLTGQWMDSRGVILALRAEIAGSALVAYWTGEESGRTEYRVVDPDAIEVTDSVWAEGEYHVFATARYRRIR